MTLTDADTAEISKKDRILTHAARVARTNDGTIQILENNEYEPADDDYPPARRVGSGDEAILGGEAACGSELGFLQNTRSAYANDTHTTSDMNARNLGET